MDANTQLCEKLATLQHLLMRRRFGAGRNAGPLADTTRGQGRILALLKVKDGVSTKDMSNVLGIRTSSLNEALSKLEAKGCIVREQSEEDKRVMVVKLTEKGRSVEQPSFEGRAAGVFDCLSDEEKAAFGAYLDRIIAQVELQMGEQAEGGFEDMRRQHEEAFKRFFGEDGPFGDGEGFPPFGGFGAAARCGGFGGFGRDGRGGCEGRTDARRDAGSR